ncbi:hypothetical protein BDR07DRAFT_1433469, partial [Suillus spraguei]
LPLGIVAFAASCTGSFSRIYSPKWIILTGLSLCMVATLLLALGGGKPENYWPFVFPAFVLGSRRIRQPRAYAAFYATQYDGLWRKT